MTDLGQENLLEKTEKLVRDLSERVEKIEGLGNSAPQYATQAFRNLDIPENLEDLSEEKLQTLYRDLKYIDNLKTSTLQGAINAQQTWEPIKDKLDILSPKTQNKFWDIYNKITDRFGGTYINYKYTIMETVEDYLFGHTNLDIDIDRAIDQIMEKYDETLEELGSKADDENTSILFTSKLKTFRK